MNKHVICTAGHVDHGKSTLINALTGIDPDRWEEEKRRGLTIDLGFAKADRKDNGFVSFIDVPGHERFLKNMLAGVGAVDGCLFVVDSTEGWKPQSEEHLRILNLLGVRKGLIALTKISLADDDLLEIVSLEIKDHLKGTFLESAPIIPVDSITGVGIDSLTTELEKMLEDTPVAKDNDRPRLWIDRVFTVKGAGTVVTGTLTGGSLKVDDEIIINPQNFVTKIRSLQSHDEQIPNIGPGSRIAINLANIDHRSIGRGSVITNPEQWFLTSTFDAELNVLPSIEHEVSRRGAYLAYIGTKEEFVKVRVLGDEVIPAGSKGLVRVYMDEKLPLMLGDRLILRESGRNETIGGAIVLDPDPILRAAEAKPNSSIERIITEHKWITPSHLEALTGVRRQEDVPGWIVDPNCLQDMIANLSQRLLTAGNLGLDITSLDQFERAAIGLLEGALIEGKYLRMEGADNLSDHPYLDQLESNLFKPPDADSVDPRELRELVRRELIIEQNGIFFSQKAVTSAAKRIRVLLKRNPEGVTVGEVRIALDSTRKYVLPLLNHLDQIGATVRRNDVRLAGKRLDEII
ncbi:MAG: selenocysteine-specific translation elongation factor [Actinobacteria bacterium]|nr:selenocysteine-specific translation elongation factor [Actinomycetota bacterium]